MAALLTGIALLVASFLVQLVVWRIALPRRQTPALLVLFAIVPPLAVAAALLLGYRIPFSVAESLRIALFYASFSLVYVCCYSAVETESASLAIVTFVASAGSVGRDDAELHARFGGGSTIGERLDQIERSGWTERAGDTITLTPQGHFWAELFELAGRTFGLKKGG
jgi:hypothetical protein